MSGDWTKIVEYPIAVALLAASVLMLFLILRRSPHRASKGLI